MSEKFTEKLMKYARTFSSKGDFGFLVERSNEFMSAKCKECQDDRLICTVKPLCEKRKWLSLLIKAGVPSKSWPQFCYEKQKQIIEKTINKQKTFYEPEDCTMMLQDFFPLVSQANPTKLMKMLENEEYDQLAWTIESVFRSKYTRVLSLNLEDLIIIIADDIVWYFDVVERYVVLNLNEERLFNQQTLLAYLKFLTKYYKLTDVKILEAAPETWVMDLLLFDIKKPEIAQNESLKALLAEEIGKLRRVSKDATFKIEDNKAHMLVQFNAFCGIPESIYSVESVNYGEIKRMAAGMADFKKKIDAWVAANNV